MYSFNSVYQRDTFHHPVLLRKMGIAAYRQWEETRNKIPAEYFEDDSSMIQEDLMSLYKRHLEVVTRCLPATYKKYTKDAEIKELYDNVSIGFL